MSSQSIEHRFGVLPHELSAIRVAGGCVQHVSLSAKDERLIIRRLGRAGMLQSFLEGVFGRRDITPGDCQATGSEMGPAQHEWGPDPLSPLEGDVHLLGGGF